MNFFNSNPKTAPVKAKMAKPIARKTIRDTIPYKRVYDDKFTKGGVIEVTDGYFTKSYLIPDTNYNSLGDEEQDSLLTSYESILVSFNSIDRYQITINNRNVDPRSFYDKLTMKKKGDAHDAVRQEYNEMRLAAFQAGKNNMKPEIYVTIGFYEKNIEAANRKFESLERELNLKFKKVNGVGIEAISIIDRLEILHDIYNIGKEGDFGRAKKVGKYTVTANDLDSICQHGQTTKDVVGPSYFRFESDHMIIGEKYARAMYLKSIPSDLSSTLISEIASVPANMLVSVHYDAFAKDKASTYAANKVTFVGGDVVKAQRKLSENGASIDLISPKLASAQQDAATMLQDITQNNKSLLHVSLVIVVFADTYEDLRLRTSEIESKARDALCSVDTLITLQEQGLNSALPLAHNVLSVALTMTSYTASALQPFSSKEIFQPNGLFYGVNQATRNMLMANRSMTNNKNCVVLGMPGAGKSMLAKNESFQELLTEPDMQAFIIDPEREYVDYCRYVKGVVIPLAPGTNSKVRINPLDLNMDRSADKDRNPLTEKFDYIVSLVEKMLRGEGALSGDAVNVIDQIVQDLYDPYIKHLAETNQTYDAAACPTLVDFFNRLRSRPEPVARHLADQIQMYCTGSLNLFAHHTQIADDEGNKIDISDAKMIVYDISNIGDNLKDLGMYVCLTDIWNRMIANRKRNYQTWVYLDEFYLMLKQKRAAEYLQMIWKRARKWGGAPTGLTQNVEDLLNNEDGLAILNTSELVFMLKQAPVCRKKLAALYDFSDKDEEYVTDVNPGEGILRFGETNIPFSLRIPSSTEIYRMMTTKPEDDQ